MRGWDFAATVPKETSGSKWTYRELLAHLTSGKTEQADANRGKAVFASTCKVSIALLFLRNPPDSTIRSNFSN